MQNIQFNQDLSLSLLALGLIAYLSLMTSKIQQYKRPLILDGGFSNTGSTSMFAATCQLRLRSIHVGKHCGFLASDDEQVDITNVSPGLVAHEQVLLAIMALKSCIVETSTPKQHRIHPCPTVKEALDGLLDRIDDVIASPDIDALHGPYQEFTDYIIEATERIRGVKPIVLLSESDPKEWASRREHDVKGLLCRLDASQIGGESFPVNPGQNMHWCLKTAMAQNKGDVPINEIFWTVGQLSDKEEYRTSILEGGLNLYQEHMETHGNVAYRVNLFGRDPLVTAEQLASEINQVLVSDLGDGSSIANDDFVGNGDYVKIFPDRIHLLDFDWRVFWDNKKGN